MPKNEGPGVKNVARSPWSPAEWLYTTLKLIVALVLFAMAALTFVDVIGRYVFVAPVPGTFETVGLLMGIVTFAALPLVTRARNHITVDLFDSLIRGGLRKVQQFIVLAGSAVVTGFIAERLFATAIDEHRANYVTEYFGISRAPLLVGLSLLCFITCLILVAMIWMYLTGRLEAKKSDSEIARILPEDRPT